MVKAMADFPLSNPKKKYATLIGVQTFSVTRAYKVHILVSYLGYIGWSKWSRITLKIKMWIIAPSLWSFTVLAKKPNIYTLVRH